MSEIIPFKDKGHSQHWAMWNWLTRNPTKWKIDYFDEHNIEERPQFFCYACDYAIYAMQHYNPNSELYKRCRYCPFGNYIDCQYECCLGGLYDKWDRIETRATINGRDMTQEELIIRSHIAHIITQLPIINQV